MTDFRRDIDCSICPVKDGKTGIATIISDDGDMETSCILAGLVSRHGARISIAVPVGRILPAQEHWRRLEEHFPIEIVNHSWNHLRIDDDSRIGIDEIRHQYLDSAEFFGRNFRSPNFTFVPPNNQITPNGHKVLDEGGFLAVRSWHRGLNPTDPAPGTEPGQWHNLRCRGVGDVGFDEEAELGRISSEPGWLIEMWHNVYTTRPANYQPIHADEAERRISAIRERDEVWFAGFGEAASYLWQRSNVGIMSFLHDGVLHLKLERKDRSLPWDRFTSPLSVRVIAESIPEFRGRAEAIDGVEDCFVEDHTGDVIVDMNTETHGQVRIL